MKTQTALPLCLRMWALLCLALVSGQAVASWTPSWDSAGPWYSDTTDYSWQPIYQGATQVGQWMCRADPTTTLAWVEIWVPYAGFKVQTTRAASARDEGLVRLVLTGSPPPPKPTTWAQKCHSWATWRFRLDQADDTGPDWQVDFESHVHAADTYDTARHVTRVDSDPNYPPTTGDFEAHTRDWTQLPAGTRYCAEFVSAMVTVRAFTLIGGSLSASAETWNSNWWAEYLP